MFVEAQSTQLNAAAVGLLGKLGFQESGHGSVFRKAAGEG